MTKPLPDPCTVAEAARWLRVTTQAVRFRIASSKLTPVATDPVRLARAAIEAWHAERIAAARKVLAR